MCVFQLHRYKWLNARVIDIAPSSNSRHTLAAFKEKKKKLDPKID
jgi:hypothetical protein